MERKLHLGCFDQAVPGWINTDVTPHLFVARVPRLPGVLYRLGLISETRFQQHAEGVFRPVKYLNVTRRFPLSNESIDFVYTSHLLEHLHQDQARFCVAEIQRVLARGGLARIAVPDLDVMISSYDPAAPNRFLDEFFEYGQNRDKNRHHWHYNEVSLTALLEETGFASVTRRGFREGDCPDLELLDNRPEITMYLEAVK